MKKTFCCVLSLLFLTGISLAGDRGIQFGLGIPHGLNLAYTIKVKGDAEIGLGMGYLLIPPNKQACGADVKWQSVNFEVIIRKPIFGGLILSGRAGYQDFAVNTVQQTVAPFYESNIGLRGPYITPSILWKFTFGNFMFMPELGAQIPISNQRYETLSGAGTLDPSVRTTIEDGIKKIDSVLPFLLFNFGVAF